ncbi:MAG: PilZ domain-containing protein [Planctomycetes bacterium]|nr:PilZ domain-containing protein [Planctomycetota bacterium]
MSRDAELPTLRMLSEVIVTLGPITHEGAHAPGCDQRSSRRNDIVLPVRLRLVGEHDRLSGPAITARSRDISDRGLGVVSPSLIELNRPCQVELFTDLGTWIGRMKGAYCTQALNGYQIGLQCIGEPPARADDERASQPVQRVSGADELTPQQAGREIQQALRRYHLAKYSWGLFGLSMEQEISRLIQTLPAPPETRVRMEPRRRHYRQEVEGEVHLAIPTADGYRLGTMDITDISIGGARLAVRTDPALPAERSNPVVQADWQSGQPLILGLWTHYAGTLWLPTRVVHCAELHPMLGMTFVGLRFGHDGSLRDYE